ncbi:MAG: phosphatidate cytidylyltransferase [Ruminococcus sp.]
MNSLKPRLITAAIGIPSIIVILLLGEFFPWIISVVFSILCVIMTIEILSARKLHNDIAVVMTCVVFAFVFPLVITTQYKLIPVYLFALAMLFIMIVKNEKIKFADVCFVFTCISLIVLGMSSMLLLRNYLGGKISFIFCLCAGIAWISDGGAYFAGVFLGKHKLCPKISPNKTVEGFIGGLLTGLLSGAFIGGVFMLIYKDFSVNFLALIILGFLGSLVSVLGDLTFSLIKRSCGIKDYGSIFPGHGGFLDRADSVIFVAPLVYLYCTNVNVVL